MPAAKPVLCPLPKLGFLRVEGTSAERFLEAQLSQKLAGLPAERAPLAAWHDAKARVQALFRVLRLPSHWLLLTHADGLAELIARLTVFVLREDVRIADVGADWRGVALVGAPAEWLRSKRVQLGSQRAAAAHGDGLSWIRAADDLVHVVGPPPAIDAAALELGIGGEAQAELAAIRAGIPDLAPALRGRFTPQMLNLDLLHALAFDKGCYPGQEVIARIHNLGSVKRRMLRFSAGPTALPAVGARVLDRAGAEAGTVVRAAGAPTGIELLAVVPLDKRDDVLVCEHDRDVSLREESLPYEV